MLNLVETREDLSALSTNINCNFFSFPEITWTFKRVASLFFIELWTINCVIFLCCCVVASIQISSGILITIPLLLIYCRVTCWWAKLLKDWGAFQINKKECSNLSIKAKYWSLIIEAGANKADALFLVSQIFFDNR